MHDKGKRFNKGKLMLDLIPATATKSLGKVLTLGASKYDDRNWEKGLSWTETIASLKRHLTDIEERRDYDESGLLHIEHVLANAAFLNHFYRTYPEGDDRPLRTNNPRRRLGLDLDGVVANFMKGVKKYIPDIDYCAWTWPKETKEAIGQLLLKEDFWLSLEPLITRDDLPAEPYCYITKRPAICTEGIIEEWLKQNNLPVSKIIVCSRGEKKSDLAIKEKIDIFVDDKYSNYIDLNKSGVVCFLQDQPHNRMFDVGYKRIHQLKDLTDKLYLF